MPSLNHLLNRANRASSSPATLSTPPASLAGHPTALRHHRRRPRARRGSYGHPRPNRRREPLPPPSPSLNHLLNRANRASSSPATLSTPPASLAGHPTTLHHHRRRPRACVRRAPRLRGNELPSACRAAGSSSSVGRQLTAALAAGQATGSGMGRCGVTRLVGEPARWNPVPEPRVSLTRLTLTQAVPCRAAGRLRGGGRSWRRREQHRERPRPGRRWRRAALRRAVRVALRAWMRCALAACPLQCSLQRCNAVYNVAMQRCNAVYNVAMQFTTLQCNMQPAAHQQCIVAHAPRSALPCDGCLQRTWSSCSMVLCSLVAAVQLD